MHFLLEFYHKRIYFIRSGDPIQCLWIYNALKSNNVSLNNFPVQKTIILSNRLWLSESLICWVRPNLTIASVVLVRRALLQCRLSQSWSLILKVLGLRYLKVVSNWYHSIKSLLTQFQNFRNCYQKNTISFLCII